MAQRRRAQITLRRLAQELNVRSYLFRDVRRPTFQRINELLDAAERVQAPLSDRMPLLRSLQSIALGYGIIGDADTTGDQVREARDRAARIFIRLGGEDVLIDRLLDLNRSLADKYLTDDIRMLGLIASQRNQRAVRALSQIVLDGRFSGSVSLNAMDALNGIDASEVERVINHLPTQDLARFLDMTSVTRQLSLQMFYRLLGAAERVSGHLSERLQLLHSLQLIAVGYGHFKGTRTIIRVKGEERLNPKILEARSRAAEVFRRLGGEDLLIDWLLEADRSLKGPYIVENIQMLKMVSRKRSRRAAMALSRIALNEGFPDFIRHQAMFALGTIGGSEAERTLIQALGSNEKSVVFSAMLALGECGTSRAIGSLKSALDRYPDYAHQVRWAVSEIMKRTRPSKTAKQ